MLKLKYILLILACVAYSVDAYMSFDEFITKFKKSYKAGTDQYDEKKKIFEKNVKTLKNKNCPVCGVTKFFDVLPEEFEKRMLDLKLPDKMISDQFPEQAKNVNKVGAPHTVDWRGAGVITRVKHQGSCGSCWAFTTAALGQSTLIMKGDANSGIDLSQQFLLQCTPNSNCGGGYLEYAIDTAIKKGLPQQSSYPYDPYTRHSGICYSLFNQRVSSKPRRSFYDLTTQQIKDLLTLGPLAIAISSTNWQYYTNGIWKCNSFDKVNHAVLLIGYSSQSWIIKNHWGPDWGQDGYMRISMNPSENCKIGTSAHMLNQSLLHSFLWTATILGLMIFSL